MNLSYNKRRPNGNQFPKGTYINIGTQERAPAFNNPYVKKHAIPVTVRRWFTDVNGTIIDKATAPAQMQTYYPLYVFGEFDRQGGYAASLKALAPDDNTKYLLSFTQGAAFSSQMIAGGFSGVNNVKNMIATGDVVHVFTDDLQNPNCFVWIVQSFNQGSLGSILSNADSMQRDGLVGPITLESWKYHADNERQYDYPFYLIRSTNLTMVQVNQLQPLMFKDPYVQQAELIEITAMFNLDQYLGIGLQFLYDTDIITLNFKLAENGK